MSATPHEGVVRIRVVTPQAVVASGITRLLEGRHNGRTITTVHNGHAPDIVFYDVIGLHDSDGLDLESLVKQGTTPVVAITRSLRPDLGEAAIRRGAQAAISMGATADDFLEIIDAAQSGHLGRGPDADDGESRVRLGREAGLTRREAEIIGLIVQGLSNRQISEATMLSINSVKSYIRSAYRKMDVASRTQAVAWGVQHGFALQGEPVGGR